jgi:hypothetical protein
VLRSKGVPTGEYAKLYQRRNYLTGRIRDSKGDLAKQAAEVDSLNAQLRALREGDSATQALLTKLQDEYDAMEARLASTSIRRRVGYVPHKFYGSWRLYVELGEDAEGNPIRQEITSDQGFFDNAQPNDCRSRPVSMSGVLEPLRRIVAGFSGGGTPARTKARMSATAFSPRMPRACSGVKRSASTPFSSFAVSACQSACPARTPRQCSRRSRH